MFSWLCRYSGDEWCCFVIAPSRGRAKALFQGHWREGDFTEVRCKKVKPANGAKAGVYDVSCPVLTELGVHYLTEEEEIELEESV